MKRQLGFVGLLCALGLAGTSCGGRSQDARGEPGPSSGGSASGGAAGIGGEANIAGAPSVAGSAAAGAPSSICPKQQPVQGDYCNFVSATNYCVYDIDKCSSVAFECFQHVWLMAPQLDGAAYDCNSFHPPNAPKDGDSCECMGLLDCTYDDCGERGRIHAVCDNTRWHVNDAPCVEQACGSNELQCQTGEVCVVHRDPLGAKYECVQNRCESTTVNCACAASLCQSNEVCSLDSGSVICSCPNC
ncbi:MAG TPA: hypothetical protein VFK05_28935 [Polyangiaceae bacterium]|nr:hypothetical protein [Polyangiaceae bacterium]